MKQSTCNEIIRLHYGGASQRRISKLLGVARKSVARVLVGHEQRRAEPVEEQLSDRSRRASFLYRSSSKYGGSAFAEPPVGHLSSHCNNPFSITTSASLSATAA
jgi:hypothetical protein